MFSLSSPYTNQPEAMTSAMGSELYSSQEQRSTGSHGDGGVGGRGSLSVLERSRQPGEGQHPQASSELTLRVALFLSHLSATETFFKPAYLEIPFLVLFSSPEC